MSDLPHRLRYSDYGAWDHGLGFEAAEEIERLKQRVARLEEALRGLEPALPDLVAAGYGQEAYTVRTLLAESK